MRDKNQPGNDLVLVIIFFFLFFAGGFAVQLIAWMIGRIFS